MHLQFMGVFPIGRSISSRHLVGRKKKIKWILSFLENGRRVILVAPRRYGKTSIVLEGKYKLADPLFKEYLKGKEV